MCVLFATATFAQTITVGSFNVRYDNPRDSGNLWSSRLPRVAALIDFHEFDIVGTQEGLQHQLDGLQDYFRDILITELGEMMVLLKENTRLYL